MTPPRSLASHRHRTLRRGAPLRRRIGRALLALAALIALVTSGGGSTVRAEATRVDEAAVPAAAVTTIARRYPHARRRAWSRETEDAYVAYVAELRDGKRRRTVVVSPEGALVREEERVSPSELPPAVRAALAASPRHVGAAIERATRVVQRGETTYELIILRPGARPRRPLASASPAPSRSSSRTWLVLSSDGKLLGEERGVEERD